MTTNILSKVVAATALLLPGTIFANTNDAEYDDQGRLTVTLAKAGTLASEVTDPYSVTYMKVVGPINGTDLRLIREMCGTDFDHNTTQGVLDTLDLSEASIKKGGKAYYKDASAQANYYTSANILGPSAFEGCSTLKCIILPDGLEEVGQRAFISCPLTAIKISDSNEFLCSVDGVLFSKDMTTIKGYPAYKVEADGTYQLPEGVTTIPSYTFMQATFGDIELSSTLKTIDEQAFFYCSALKKVSIGAATDSIASDAFLGCSSLSEITIDAASTAFSVLDGVLFNKSQTRLLLYPLGLGGTSYTVPNQVQAIGDYAFALSTTLKSISLPEGLTSLGTASFGACTQLTQMDIPEGVTLVPDFLFQGCSELASVSLPSSISQLGQWSFDQCGKLTAITLPDGITTIPEGCFNDCSGITEFRLPESVTVIGIAAFNGCTAATYINIPSGVSSIGSYSFMGCSSLTSVIVPEGITELPYASFMEDKNLATISLPSTLKSVGDFVFVDCSGLKSIYCGATAAPSCGNSVFFRANSKADLHVPANSISSYKADATWSTFNIIGDVTNGISLPQNQTEGTEEYYTLDGRKTTGSTHGLVIVKKNGKTMKIIKRP